MNGIFHFLSHFGCNRPFIFIQKVYNFRQQIQNGGSTKDKLTSVPEYILSSKSDDVSYALSDSLFLRSSGSFSRSRRCRDFVVT
jgi:hypothetical protein